MLTDSTQPGGVEPPLEAKAAQRLSAVEDVATSGQATPSTHHAFDGPPFSVDASPIPATAEGSPTAPEELSDVEDELSNSATLAGNSDETSANGEGASPKVFLSAHHRNAVSFQAMSSFGLSTASFDVSQNVESGDTRTVDTADLTAIMAEDPSLSFDKARLMLVDAQMRAAGIDPATGLPLEMGVQAQSANGRWVCRNCSFNNRSKKSRSVRRLGRKKEADQRVCENCGWTAGSAGSTHAKAASAAAKTITEGTQANQASNNGSSKRSSRWGSALIGKRRKPKRRGQSASPRNSKPSKPSQPERSMGGLSSLSTLSPEDAAEVATFLRTNPLGFAWEHHTSILRSRNWGAAPYLFARQHFFNYHRKIKGLDDHIEKLLAQREPSDLGSKGDKSRMSEQQRAGLIVELMKSLRSWAGERPKRRQKFHDQVDQWRSNELLPSEATVREEKFKAAQKAREEFARRISSEEVDRSSPERVKKSGVSADAAEDAAAAATATAAAEGAAAAERDSVDNWAAVQQDHVRLIFIRHGEGDHNACKQVAGTWYQDASLTVLGIEQALVTGSIMRHVAVDKVLVSPLTRALESCALMFHDRLKRRAVEAIVCPEAREFRSTHFMRSHMGSSPLVLRQRFGSKPTYINFNATCGPVPLNEVFDKPLLAPEQARLTRMRQLPQERDSSSGAPPSSSSTGGADFDTVNQLSSDQMMTIADNALARRSTVQETATRSSESRDSSHMAGTSRAQLAKAGIRHQLLVSGAGCRYSFLGAMSPRYIANVASRFAPHVLRQSRGASTQRDSAPPTHAATVDASQQYVRGSEKRRLHLDAESCRYTLKRMSFGWPSVEAAPYPPRGESCVPTSTRVTTTDDRRVKPGYLPNEGEDPDHDGVSDAWRVHATNHFQRRLPQVWSPMETQWQFCLRADRLRRWIAASFAPGSTVALVAHGTLFKAMFPGELAMKNCEFRSFFLNPFDGSFATNSDVMRRLSEATVASMMEQSGRAIKKNRDQADIDAEQALQKEQEALENQRAMQEQKAPYKNFVEVEAVGQQLRAIFQEYHPSKVPDVSRLLHKHAGRETAFLASVKHRYQLTAHSELVDAVAKGHTEMVRLLLESKANVSDTNSEGHTLLHIAIENKFPKIAALINEAAAHDDHHSKHRRKMKVSKFTQPPPRTESNSSISKQNRSKAVTMSLDRTVSATKQAAQIAKLAKQELEFAASHPSSFLVNVGAELRSTLSFLSVFDVTVFCRSVNGRINTLRKQNDTLRYTSSVVAKEDQVGRAIMGPDVGAQVATKGIKSSISASGRIGFRPQFEKRTFYLDLSEGALLYCSTPQRVSLKFNWLTQYKSIKLSARSRAVHNFTPGARRNLDVTEFYVVEDISRSDSRWWLLAAQDEVQKWIWINVVNSVAMEYCRYRPWRKRAWPAAAIVRVGPMRLYYPARFMYLSRQITVVQKAVGGVIQYRAKNFHELWLSRYTLILRLNNKPNNTEFKVESPGQKAWWFKAASPSERDSWIKCLREIADHYSY